VLRRNTSISIWAVVAGWLLMAPVAVQAEEIGDYTGPQLFQRFCASCHGKTAEGDGPAATTFRMQVPDLTRLSKRRGGEFPRDLVRRIIDGTDVKAPHGSREMPVWGQEFWLAQGADEAARQKTNLLIYRLVEYLALLQR
jgi:mono/diheme cytochrome c family protein